MLSRHSTRRDRHGLPITSRERRQASRDATPQECEQVEKRNRNNKALRVWTTEIRDLLEQTEFMERWFLPHLRPPRDPSALELASKSISHLSDRSVADELEALADMRNSARQRWQEIYKIMTAGMVYTMKWMDDCNPRAASGDLFSKPATLIRLWTEESHSPYTDELGFRCSGWESCGRYSSLGALQHDNVLSLQSLRSHCEKESRPSVWISCSESASWMLYYAKRWNLEGNATCRVAIVSMERLERCNIPWGRSDELVRLTGGNTFGGIHQDGVKYAWSRHILVYGTIPAHCLISTMTLQRFFELCEEHKIRGLSLTPLPLAIY